MELPAGTVRWVGAQEHYGENIGDTDSHSIFIELKESHPAGGVTTVEPLGPSTNKRRPPHCADNSAARSCRATPTR